eukprot:3818327-Rhodomonas_salina.5
MLCSCQALDDLWVLDATQSRDESLVPYANYLCASYATPVLTYVQYSVTLSLRGITASAFPAGNLRYLPTRALRDARY